MEMLPGSFGIFTAMGIWRPLHWSSGLKKHLYDFYTFLMLILVYTFAFMEFVDMMKSFGNVEEMVSASFMLLTVCNTLCKYINILSRRAEITAIFGILDSEFCRTRHLEEVEIQEKFRIRIRNNGIWYTCLVSLTVMLITAASVIQNIPNRTLPFKAWVPSAFNLTSDNIYWYLYYHQVIAHAAVAIISIGYDIFVPGVMLVTCWQLRLLKFRQENMDKYVDNKENTLISSKANMERRILHEFICHHNHILEFAMSINDVFSTVIFIQYAVSLFVICISIYRLAGMKINNPEYPFALFYMLCMANQILCFCWYGNEVILESLEISEAICKMNWLALHIKTQRDLLIIMRRSFYPIVFTSGKMLTLSLESFTAIMKLSYTAFNVLQQK